jgi:hypothetical protein
VAQFVRDDHAEGEVRLDPGTFELSQAIAKDLHRPGAVAGSGRVGGAAPAAPPGPDPRRRQPADLQRNLVRPAQPRTFRVALDSARRALAPGQLDASGSEHVSRDRPPVLPRRLIETIGIPYLDRDPGAFAGRGRQKAISRSEGKGQHERQSTATRETWLHRTLPLR